MTDIASTSATTVSTVNNLVAENWAIANLLRGDFKQSQHGRIILPLALLRRLECVLEASKDAVLAEAEKVAKMKLPEEAAEKFLLRAAGGLTFYNTSKMDLGNLGAANIEVDLLNYLQGFSADVREIFEHFKFAEFVGQLAGANLLFEVVQKIRTIDVSVEAVSNHDMGLVFEELIRRFAEGSNETAGEHFTPRDIVRLTTSLVFMEDDDALTKDGAIRTLYDPTAGTGGFLSSGEEYVRELNPSAKMVAYGQELNPESFAICKAYMLIKGQAVSNIKLGNTLSQDQLYGERFDYMLSSPPFGVDWKKIEGEIKREHSEKGIDGRFGPGLPRVSDGSLLFLLHLIQKLRDVNEGGGRIGIILNGSPMFTGGAGSGESEIRRYLLEQDLVEGIVALPTDIYYNTGIATYIWILSNHKSAERKGKVQLVNASKLSGKMRQSLGSKRNEMKDEDIRAVTRVFADFKEVPLPEDDSARELSCKIFPTHAFGYRRLTIERPLRQSYRFSAERLDTLRFGPRALIAVQTWAYSTYAVQLNWGDNADCEHYGDLSSVEEELRVYLNISFPDLGDKSIKDLLDAKIWQANKRILLKARELTTKIGEAQSDDMNSFGPAIQAAAKKATVTLDSKEKKTIEAAVSWCNPDAEKVIKKIHKNTEANPLYGLFDDGGQAVEYVPSADLRDRENIPLDLSRSVDETIKEYVQREVLSRVSDAWIDQNVRDGQDGKTGVVGFEILFGSLFSKFLDTNPSESRVKLKNIIEPNRSGLFFWNAYQLNFRRSDESDNFSRFNIDENQLDPDFFEVFLSSSENEGLRNYASEGMGRGNLPLSRLVECDIHIPELGQQKNVVQLFAEHDSIMARAKSIRSSILCDPNGAEIELQKYHDLNARYENDFVHSLPHPLAVLWVQSKYEMDEKKQCQEYVRFHEILGLFSLSVVFGLLSDEEVKGVFKSNKQKGGSEKPEITMGNIAHLLEKVRELHEGKVLPQFSVFISPGWVSLLKEATKIRNVITHQGLPAKSVVMAFKYKIDKLNDELVARVRGFFEQIVLASPITGKLMKRSGGKDFFLNDLAFLSGLALNPAIVKKIGTIGALLDGELYMVLDSPKDTQVPYRLFPLVRLLDVDEDSGVNAFYFYGGWDKESDQHVYICPYPCAVPNKYFSHYSLYSGDCR